MTKLLIWFIGCLCVSILSVVHAESAYPNKPIHLVVPFPAGGAADIVARVIAKPLSDKLGQPVVVDNKPGADGMLAAETVAKATPDGYTLFMATYGAMSVAPHLHKSVPYDVLKDFTPITSTGKFSFFLFAHPDVPAKTIPELIEYVHSHPGLVNYGTGNVGSIVATAEFANRNHLSMTHIPYKGEVPAMNDFLTGRVQLMIGTPVNALPWVKEGKLKALAALSDSRSPLLPEVPTMHELGMSNLSVTPWSGIFGPANMSPHIAQHLNVVINQVLNDKEVQSEFAKQAFVAQGSSTAELGRYTKSQLKVWGIAAVTAGLKAE
jgi:tripartite-type tricarboxylate transporter receptor subunit TctC